MSSALLGLALLPIAAAAPSVIVYPVTSIRSTDSIGIWLVEVRDGLAYRWTGGAVSLRLPNTALASRLRLTLRLTAPQYPGARPVAAQVASGRHAAARFAIAPEWRRYHLLVTAATPYRKDVTIHLFTETWQPDNDRRQMGVALSGEVVARQAGAPRLWATLERWGLYVTLGGLLAALARRPRWLLAGLMGVLALTLTGFAIWAPLQATEALPGSWWRAAELAVVLAGVEAVRHR